MNYVRITLQNLIEEIITENNPMMPKDLLTDAIQDGSQIEDAVAEIKLVLENL